MKQQRFSIKARFKSFVYAFNGLKILWQEEHNSRIHFVAVVLVTFVSFFLHLSFNEWVAVILCFGFVISTEIINSSIENIADFISPEKHDKIKKIKDLAAAAVLVAAITAVIVGILIFVPKIKILLC